MISDPKGHGIVDEDLLAQWAENDAQVAEEIRNYRCWTPKLDALAHAQADLAMQQWNRNLWRQLRPWVIAGAIAIGVLVGSLIVMRYLGL